MGAWASISAEAKTLIDQMKMSARKRLSAQEVLDASWSRTSCTPEFRHGASTSLLLNIKSFMQLNRLKQCMLTCIARHITVEQDVQNIREQFHRLDQDGDGFVSVPELLEGCASAGFALLEQVE